MTETKNGAFVAIGMMKFFGKGILCSLLGVALAGAQPVAKPVVEPVIEEKSTDLAELMRLEARVKAVSLLILILLHQRT